MTDSPSEAERATILLVEDTLELAQVVARELEASGYRVLRAAGCRRPRGAGGARPYPAGPGGAG
ncbi:MAG: hypothetical protein M3442_03455, partial [Chloroflexota bacterium]|nr:hypothetical protein [Chloroflexota bacterium]